MSQVWVIRAGRQSKDQHFALDNDCAVIGWGHLGNVRDYESVEEVKVGIKKQEPHSSDQSIAVSAWQVWRFANTDKNRDSVKKGDWIILPLKGGVSNHHAAVGKVAGGYRFKKRAPDGCKHQRAVEWVNKRFPNKAIPHPLSNQATVSQVKNGEEVARALDGRGEAEFDAADGVKRAIMREFKGRDMEMLVAKILEALGYQRDKLKGGTDGGLDVVARHTTDELVDPVCAQVKNTQDAKGAPDIQRLVGAMGEHPEGRVHNKGLFVSMGGFKDKPGLKKRFPHIRLWDADDILRLIGKHYANLGEQCKKRLPPKKEFLALAAEAQE